jgi:hypothetical protein
MQVKQADDDWSRNRCGAPLVSADQLGEGLGVATERRLEAHQVEAIFRAFAEVMRELPPDTEAGWLDAAGDLRLAPDIGRKLRTARSVRDLLRQMREARDADK